MSDLSDFFQTISVAKKQHKEELESILGSSIESLSEEVVSSINQEKRIDRKPKQVINKHKKIRLREEAPEPEQKEENSINYYTKFIDDRTKENQIEFIKEEKNSTQEFKELRNLVLQLMRDVHLQGGGGEVNLAFMDIPITSVTSSSYTAILNDYYIGVNYSGAVSITLPHADREGKVFIVKDELGEASKGTNRYITILPTGSDLIDDKNKAILAYDYGSLTFIWKNNSWRVV